MKNKKPLWISLIVLDMGVTIFFLVISIMMLADMAANQNNPDYNISDPTRTGLIAYLQRNTTVYLVGFVIPLFLLLAANIIALVVYVRKTTKKELVQVEQLSEEQKEALRQELLKELQEGKK